MIYFDANASYPILEESRKAILDQLKHDGNASSVHRYGQKARATIENVRSRIAQQLEVNQRNVFFQSGASEANCLVLSPKTAGGCHMLLCSATEHPSVSAGGRFSADQIFHLPVDSQGNLDLEVLSKLLNAHKKSQSHILVSVAHANNETGVIQNMREISKIVHEEGALLHVDAAQTFGRIDFGQKDLGFDFLSISGHKMGGPNGIGALVRADDDYSLDPLVKGGGQEGGIRAGTENVAAIAGMGAVCGDHALSKQGFEKLIVLRDELESGLGNLFCDDVIIFGESADRLSNTCCFALPSLKAETALIALDLEGYAVSSGSACSSGKVGISPVIKAMGYSEDIAKCALRVSFHHQNNLSQVIEFLNILKRVFNNSRRSC